MQSAEGLVIDRVHTENLLINPSICEFWDYTDAAWICQIIPMKRGQAEALYKKNLANAKICQSGQGEPSHKKAKRLASMQMNAGSSLVTDEQQIAALEIWDRATQRINTMVEGTAEWLREPYSPPRARALVSILSIALPSGRWSIPRSKPNIKIKKNHEVQFCIF